MAWALAIANSTGVGGFRRILAEDPEDTLDYYLAQRPDKIIEHESNSVERITLKGLQRYDPWVALLWCALVVGWFILLMSWMPPIIAAAGYTLFSIVMYRICYATYTSYFRTIQFSKLSFCFCMRCIMASIFLFGVLFFLGRAIRQNNNTSLFITVV